MRCFRPDHMFEHVADITLDFLRQKDIRGLLLDIDGTLMPIQDRTPAPAVLRWIAELQSAGILLYILSNNKSAERVQALGEQLGIHHSIHLAGKPRRRGYMAALKATGLMPRQLAMVGDQIFTDIWGANRSGIWSFYVESMDTVLWYLPLRRIAERPFKRQKEMI